MIIFPRACRAAKARATSLTRIAVSPTFSRGAVCTTAVGVAVSHAASREVLTAPKAPAQPGAF